MGGWGKENVCPGEFAKQLMATAEREAQLLCRCSTAPAYLMDRAHSGVQEMKVGTIYLLRQHVIQEHLAVNQQF